MKFGPGAVTTLISLDFSPPPGVRSAARPAIGAGADRPAEPELLGRACLVAVGAQISRVRVTVIAAQRQRGVPPRPLAEGEKDSEGVAEELEL